MHCTGHRSPPHTSAWHGELVGGCTDTLDAWRNGRLQAMLEATHTEFDRAADVDPYAFLPRWLQPR